MMKSRKHRWVKAAVLLGAVWLAWSVVGHARASEAAVEHTAPPAASR